MAVLDTTKLTEIYINCDDFCKELSAYELSQNCEHTTLVANQSGLSTSEMMSIVIFYHHSGMRCFSWYYQQVLQKHFLSYLPELCSYNRFIQKLPRLFFPLYAFLLAHRLSYATEGNYIDATKLVVCHNKRIFNHQVFKGFASRGKSSTGWFFGFKLHAIINSNGQLVVAHITTGSVADNNQELLKAFSQRFQGFLYGDKGYISAIKAELAENGMILIHKNRKNMNKQPLTPEQKYYLKYRGLIESAFDLMKNYCDIEHSRHRSTKNFLVNLVAGLVAYTYLDHTPTIPAYQHKMDKNEMLQIELI